MKRRALGMALGIVAMGALALVLARRDRPGAVVASPDAASASPSDAASATVAVYDDGHPMANRWVVFHDAAGTVTSAVQTGRDGKAAAPVSRGDQVTVAYGTSMKSLVTVVGIEPNDVITVGEDEDEGGADESLCTAVVSLPAEHAAATRYTVDLGVGPAEIAPGAALRLSVLSRFVKDGRFQVLAEALDARGAPLAYAHAWLEGCSADAGRPLVEARLPAWRTDYRPVSVEVTAREGEGATVAGKMSFELGGPGDRYARGTREARLSPRTTLRFEAPRPVDARTKVKVAVAYGGTTERYVLEEERAGVVEAWAFDLREHALPRISDVVIDGATTARPSVRWRMADQGDATTADAVVAQLSWPATGEHVWTILLAPDAPRTLTLPALPDALSPWRPDGRPVTASVALIDASYVNGFPEVKRRGLVAFEDPPTGDRAALRYSVVGALDF